MWRRMRSAESASARCTARRRNAVESALHLDDPDLHFTLGDAEWRAALDYADRERLTLVFREAAREHVPEWVRERLDRDAEKNGVRLEEIARTYRELAEW